MTTAIHLPSVPTEIVESRESAFFRLALLVGQKGIPAPNPHVGAVVVRDGAVVGLGHHEKAGTAHAEAVALERARARAWGGTLYVTLEPCNHYGRTPPCVDAIVRSGIVRVVIGCPDPNPHVRGGGARCLEANGVEVVWSPLLAEAESLIESWQRSLPRQVRHVR